MNDFVQFIVYYTRKYYAPWSKRFTWIGYVIITIVFALKRVIHSGINPRYSIKCEQRFQIFYRCTSGLFITWRLLLNYFVYTVVASTLIYSINQLTIILPFTATSHILYLFLVHHHVIAYKIFNYYRKTTKIIESQRKLIMYWSHYFIEKY